MRTAMKAAFGSLAALVCATSTSAATLMIDGDGQLTGARGIDIGGVSYDVEFVDGSCVEVFSGCNSSSDFAFRNQANADLASQALLDQVLIDGPLGLFDSMPALTEGCSGILCNFFIPYSLGSFGPTLTVQVSAAQNEPFNTGGDFDRVISSNLIRSSQIDALGSSTWARFTLTQAVPEPGTWLMMILGFGAIGGMMRSSSKAAQNLRVRYASTWPNRGAA